MCEPVEGPLGSCLTTDSSFHQLQLKNVTQGSAASVYAILHFLSFLGWNKWLFRDSEPVSNEIVRGGGCPERETAEGWLMD